jgi:glycosyltransferase 2 family protein
VAVRLISYRRAARWLPRVAISVALAVYILVDVDTGDLASALASVRLGPLLLAVGIYLFGQGLSAYKWSLLGRSVGFALPLHAYVRFYFVGMFFNLFGLSTLGGDLVRALYLGGGRRPGLAINSVVFDRVSGLVTLMVVGAVAILAFPHYDFPWVLSASIAGGAALLVIGWWLCPRLVKLLPARNWIRRQVEVELAPFWRDRQLLARAVVVSLVFHLTQVVVQYVTARAAGVSVPLSYCLIFHPVISVMTALPFSVGGFGVREGGYIYFLTRMNVDDSLAVTCGLLWFAVTVVAGLVGGVVFLAAGARLPRVRAEAPAPADVTAA